MHHQYAYITRSFPGWSITEIRGLTSRERRYWMAISDWHPMGVTSG